MNKKSPSMSPSISIAIFSYNRGAYLHNLLNSIERLIPSAHVMIFDDASDDPLTQNILKESTNDIHINQTQSKERHGNLYNNMQSAIEKSPTRILLLLQDDTQIIRALGEEDFKAIDKVFSDPNIAFLRPQFLKESNAERFILATSVDPNTGNLVPKKSYDEVEPGNAFCDVVLCDISKLKSVNWKFHQNERANQNQAKSHFSHMPFMRNPFLFYCPEVPSYRDRKLYLASRIVQNKRKGEVVSFNILEGQSLSNFMNRAAEIPPIAENFLTTNFDNVKRPFVYQDYARSPWLHALYKIESRLYRIWKGIKRQ